MLNCDSITSDTLDVMPGENFWEVVQRFWSEAFCRDPGHVEFYAVETDVYDKGICTIKQVRAVVVDQMANPEKGCRGPNP